MIGVLWREFSTSPDFVKNDSADGVAPAESGPSLRPQVPRGPTVSVDLLPSSNERERRNRSKLFGVCTSRIISWKRHRTNDTWDSLVLYFLPSLIRNLMWLTRSKQHSEDCAQEREKNTAHPDSIALKEKKRSFGIKTCFCFCWCHVLLVFFKENVVLEQGYWHRRFGLSSYNPCVCSTWERPKTGVSKLLCPRAT